MPLEKPGFRENLARLDETYPGRETIKIADAAAYLGIYRGTLLGDRTFPAIKVGGKSKYGGSYVVPKVALARWMS